MAKYIRSITGVTVTLIENFERVMVFPKTYNGVTYKIIGPHACYNDPRIEEIDFSNTRVTTFQDSCFIGLPNLKKFVFPNSVTTVEGNVLCATFKLHHIDIPPKLKTMTGYAFNQGGITSFSVDPNNQWFCTDGKNLFNKDKTILYVASRDVKSEKDIPWINGVKKLGDFVFTNNPVSTHINGLKTFTAPSSVTIVDKYCFHATFELDYLDLSNTQIKIIPTSCFETCMAKTVIFPNTLTTIKAVAFPCIFAPRWLVLPESIKVIEDAAFQLNGFNINTGVLDVNVGIQNIKLKGCKNFAKNNIFTEFTWPVSRRDNLKIYANYCYSKGVKAKEFFGFAPVIIEPPTLFIENRMVSLKEVSLFICLFATSP